MGQLAGSWAGSGAGNDWNLSLTDMIALSLTDDHRSWKAEFHLSAPTCRAAAGTAGNKVWWCRCDKHCKSYQDCTQTTAKKALVIAGVFKPTQLR